MAVRVIETSLGITSLPCAVCEGLVMHAHPLHDAAAAKAVAAKQRGDIRRSARKLELGSYIVADGVDGVDII